MKIGIGADTSDFEKGAKQVKQGLKDLEKTGSSALESLGSAFGVNTGKISQMTSAIRGLGQKFSECGVTGVSAFGNVLKSISPIGGAIAGLGISAAVAGFKNLAAEANAFKQTVEGANIEMATAAYADTYRQILRDFNGDTARAIAETQSEWKKGWGEFRAVISDYFASGKFLNPAGSAQESVKQYKDAREGAEKAEQLTKSIYELERKRKEQAVELADLNASIAEQMQVAKDASVSTADRQEALYKVELMLSQKRALSVDLEERLAELYKARVGLASSSVEEEDAALAQRVRANEVARAITQEETSLLRIKNSIGKASEAEISRMNTLIAKQKELEANMAAMRSKWADMATPISAISSASFPGVTGPSLSILPQRQDVEYFKETFQAYLGDWQISVGVKADTDKIHDITNEMTSLLESSVARTGEIIGNLVGTLAGGGDAWGSFKNAALAAFGDMAIAVGKIAVSMGTAAAGINVALKDTGQWYIAVAAGAALIALGSAVKSSLSAVASGDYSAAGGGYSSGYSSGSSGSDYVQREVKVYVTGTLEADGDRLLAVIQNTEKKNYYTR